MARGKSEKEIMEIARNICREKGINIDEAYAQFKSFMKRIQKMAKRQHTIINHFDGGNL